MLSSLQQQQPITFRYKYNKITPHTCFFCQLDGTHKELFCLTTLQQQPWAMCPHTWRLIKCNEFPLRRRNFRWNIDSEHWQRSPFTGGYQFESLSCDKTTKNVKNFNRSLKLRWSRWFARHFNVFTSCRLIMLSKCLPPLLISIN